MGTRLCTGFHTCVGVHIHAYMYKLILLLATLLLVLQGDFSVYFEVLF